MSQGTARSSRCCTSRTAPHYPATLALVERVRAELGIDTEPATEYTVACRLYRLEHRFAGHPEERWVREALLEAAGRS
jgi:hypothetical protein